MLSHAAEFRWLASGTPVSTSVEDLYGQFCVLGMSPFNTSNFFNYKIKHAYGTGAHRWAENVFWLHKYIQRDIAQCQRHVLFALKCLSYCLPYHAPKTHCCTILYAVAGCLQGRRSGAAVHVGPVHDPSHQAPGAGRRGGAGAAAAAAGRRAR